MEEAKILDLQRLFTCIWHDFKLCNKLSSFQSAYLAGSSSKLSTSEANQALRRVDHHLLYEMALTEGWTEANGGGNTDTSGLGLPYTYYNNWAYLSETGVPDATTGALNTFPIIIGEFGNVFNSERLSSHPLDSLSFQ